MNKKENLTQIKNRLKELAKLIKLHNVHYHQKDRPIISDGEFDKLVNENSYLEKKYPDLIIKNGPNDTIGSKLKNKFKKIPQKSITSRVLKNTIFQTRIFMDSGALWPPKDLPKSMLFRIFFENVDFAKINEE